jgi:hypothetical protein
MTFEGLGRFFAERGAEQTCQACSDTGSEDPHCRELKCSPPFYNQISKLITIALVTNKSITNNHGYVHFNGL